MSMPATSTRPALLDSSVAMILIVVVLPAPLGPRKPKNSPWSDGEINAVDGAGAAGIGLFEALDEDGGMTLQFGLRRTV